jgi:hypothetical protein
VQYVLWQSYFATAVILSLAAFQAEPKPALSEVEGDLARTAFVPDSTTAVSRKAAKEELREELRQDTAFFPLLLTYAISVARKLSCTFSAAVTIALLDSTTQSGSNNPSRNKFPLNFSTQQKNLCYYAALILM